MTDDFQNPHEAALQHIRNIRDKVVYAANIATKLMNTTLTDAVIWTSSSQSGNCPKIMSTESLVEFQLLNQSLNILVEHYTVQENSYSIALGLNKDKEEKSALSTHNDEKSSPVELNAPRHFADGTPTVSAAREDAAILSKLRQGTPEQETSPVLAEAVKETSNGKQSPLLDIFAENSISTLYGKQSPLLDIFACSPWLPEGRGKVTISSPGYKWYQNSNPLTKDKKIRATLPSGFYDVRETDDPYKTSTIVPRCVLIRTQTCILIWYFRFDESSMSVYMAGVSDTIPSETARWFNPTSLPASLTRRLLQELRAYYESCVL